MVNAKNKEEILDRVEKIITNRLSNNRLIGVNPEPLTEDQLKTLTKYKEYYEQLPSPRGGGIKPKSLWNAVMSIRLLGVFLKKINVNKYEDATKEDLIKYIVSLKGKSDATKSVYKTYIRSFYKWMYGIKEKHKFPDVVDDPRFVPQKRKNKKKPQDLYTHQEIKKLLDVAGSNRARCIIMLSLGEGGMRAGEMASLNLSSVEFDEKGVKIWIEKSKSKERYVRFVRSEPYLREYINNEYGMDKTNSNNPLFYTMSSPRKERLRPYAFTEVLRRTAKKAKINKRIYTHLGRACNISYLTKKGFSAEISAKRFGITAGTLRDVYLTIDDKDVDEAYLKLESNLTNEEREKIRIEEELLTPKVCPRCKLKVPVNAFYCNCGMVIDEGEAIRLQNKEEKAKDKMGDFVSPDAMQKLFKMVMKLQEDIKKVKN